MYNSLGQCGICKKEYTSMHVEYRPGSIMYVCPQCMEKSKDYFIWICVNCGEVYLKPKEQVLRRMEQSGLENAALLGEGSQLFLGIDICIACSPEGIVEYVKQKEEDEVEVCAK